MKKYKNFLIVMGILLVVIVLTVVLVLIPSKPGVYDDFAACLEEAGATFYGAFWCPACQTQKGLFGRSAGKLPYVECSTPDGRNMNQTCSGEGIESYPTWEFADGERETGVLSLEDLAQRTNCPLPSLNS